MNSKSLSPRSFYKAALLSVAAAAMLSSRTAFAQTAPANLNVQVITIENTNAFTGDNVSGYCIVGPTIPTAGNKDVNFEFNGIVGAYGVVPGAPFALPAYTKTTSFEVYCLANGYNSQGQYYLGHSQFTSGPLSNGGGTSMNIYVTQ